MLQGPHGANFFTSLLTNWVPQKDYLALLLEKQCQPRGGSTPQLDQHRTLQRCLMGKAPNFGPAISRMLLMPGASLMIQLETCMAWTTWEQIAFLSWASDLSFGAVCEGSRLGCSRSAPGITGCMGVRKAGLGIRNTGHCSQWCGTV